MENHKSKGVDFDFWEARQYLEGADGTVISFSKGIVTFKNGKLRISNKTTTENKISGLQHASWYDNNTYT